MMKNLVVVAGAAVLVSAALTLTGCGPAEYSELVKYGLRIDPMLIGPAADLGDMVPDPDPPGVLPLLALKDISEYRNPMAKKAEKSLEKELFRDPTQVPPDLRLKLDKKLEEMFGTPRNPKVAGLSAAEKKELRLDDETLRTGSKLYRIHCVHCHGVAGDGRGPTARWVNPHPRDFRQGIFKFQSVDQAKDGRTLPPARRDLLRTLEKGLEGSAMPSFVLLPVAEREALTSYVIHLALRGKAEYDTLKNSFALEKSTGTLAEQRDEENPGAVEGLALYHKINVGNWMEAQKPERVIQVAKYPFADTREELVASMKRGKALFLGDKDHEDPRVQKEADKAKCVSCHLNYGRSAPFRYDDWGTMVRPNNFLNGVFRAGRRPVDAYYRMHSGINGSGMNRFGGSSGLSAESMWDLANFVTNMAYPAMRKEVGILD